MWTRCLTGLNQTYYWFQTYFNYAVDCKHSNTGTLSQEALGITTTGHHQTISIGVLGTVTFNDRNSF